jgi:hypothetical protein
MGLRHSLAVLRQAARDTAERRGHTLGKFSPLRGITNTWGAVSSAECQTCGAWVQVTPKPAPNGIEVGGSAVAVVCARG